jgi:hypothetical protein
MGNIAVMSTLAPVGEDLKTDFAERRLAREFQSTTAAVPYANWRHSLGLYAITI